MYKSGDSCLLTNYRPISVLPGIAKVFESIVHQQVFSYFLLNNLLMPAQSGFRPGHSNQDLLLKVTEDWKSALDRDYLVGTVFIDLIILLTIHYCLLSCPIMVLIMTLSSGLLITCHVNDSQWSWTTLTLTGLQLWGECCRGLFRSSAVLYLYERSSWKYVCVILR